MTGQQVLEGMRLYALEQFGPLAAQVWRSWGVRETMDWGRIVFLLVDHGLLNRQDSDTIDDFSNGFDFDAVFVDAYEPCVPASLDGAGTPEGPNVPGSHGSPQKESGFEGPGPLEHETPDEGLPDVDADA